MKSEIERAREIARGIELTNTWLDGAQSGEVARLLEALADAAEEQASKLSAIEFALLYYSEPHLYLDSKPRSSAEPILDGGLRARTALGLLKSRARARRLV